MVHLEARAGIMCFSEFGRTNERNVFAGQNVTEFFGVLTWSQKVNGMLMLSYRSSNPKSNTG